MVPPWMALLLAPPPPSRVRAGQHPWSGLLPPAMPLGEIQEVPLGWNQGIRCLGCQSLPG